jgi:hypothetical protein
MNWEQKYLKYKKKYFELLKIGGQPGRCKKTNQLRKMKWKASFYDDDEPDRKYLYTINTLNISYDGKTYRIHPNFKVYDNTYLYTIYTLILKLLKVNIDIYGDDRHNILFYNDLSQIIKSYDYDHPNYTLLTEYNIKDGDTLYLQNTGRPLIFDYTKQDKPVEKFTYVDIEEYLDIDKIYIKSGKKPRAFNLGFKIKEDTLAKNVLNKILNIGRDPSTTYQRDNKNNIINKEEADLERKKYILYKEGSDDKITMNDNRLFHSFKITKDDVLILEKNEDKVAEELKKLRDTGFGKLLI